MVGVEQLLADQSDGSSFMASSSGRRLFKLGVSRLGRRGSGTLWVPRALHLLLPGRLL